MAPKKYIQTAADIEMKPHYQCSAAECRKEMSAAGTPPHQDLSISELRVMLRESRIRRGLLQVKEPGQDQMARIKKANKSELQELIKAYQLPSMEKATVGEMKLALRQAVIDDCDGDTKISFGKHQGATFMEVMSTDHQYAMWATREVKHSESPDWKLIQFARWVNKMENVEEPAGDTPFMSSGAPMAYQTPQSGATGEAPLAWAGLVVPPGQNRHLTMPSRNKANASMQVDGGTRQAAAVRSRGNQGRHEPNDAQDSHLGIRAERSQGGSSFSILQDSQDQHQLRESLSSRGASVREDRSGSASQIYEEPACLIQTLQPEAALRLGRTLEEGFFHGLDQLLDQGRLFLLEVACAPDSVLTNEALAKGLTAERASLFNGCDLTSPEGLRKTLELVKKKRPKNIWISTECGPFSPIQNFNQRTEAQQQDLQRKQHEARKQHIGGLVVAYFGRSIGSEIHWEWSRWCRAWKWDPIEQYRNNLQTETSIVSGCRVGLTDDKGGGLLGKEWRVETTDHDFAKDLQIKCEGSECSCHHVKCEGRLTRKSAFYTQTMAKRIIHYMKQSSSKHIRKCMQNEQTKDHQEVKMGQYKKKTCNCRLFRWKGQVQLCSSCILSERAFVGEGNVGEQWGEEDMLDEDPDVSPQEGDGEWDPQEKKEWRRKIKLVHCATGHGSVEGLVHTLKQKGLGQKVIDLAKDFKCEVCEERKRPAPRRVATLEVVPKRWTVALADYAVWRHPISKERITVGLIMDQGSRFLVGKILGKGESSNVKSSQYIEFYQSHWLQYFGHPDFLRFDAEGTWRSREIDSYFSKNQVMLDPIPGDAHWHLSPLERSIAWLKELLSRLAQETSSISTHEAVHQALNIWNRREMVRGFSPHQHALGQAPDLDGRFFRDDVRGLPVEIMETPIGELERHQGLRLQAEETFLKWQAKERLARVMNSKSKPIPVYTPGELVFYWRRLGRKEAGQRYQTGHFHGYAGPARVLALETRFDEDGNVRPSSVVWLVRNNRLLKASVEQLRKASNRETILAELDKDLRLPWTISEIVAPLGKNEYDDITVEAKDMPSEEDKERVARFWEPPTKRHRTKRPVELPGEEEEVQEQNPSLPSRPTPMDIDPEEDPLLYAKGVEEEHQAFWNDEKAYVEMEIPLPQSRHGWMQMSKDVKAYIVNTLKKKSVEVFERHMDEDTKVKFQGAKKTEISKFLASEALEALPARLQPPKTQAMSMRWLLSWKVDGDGKTVPKARLVVLGYQDPKYEHRITYAPTTTRHTRQLMLQYAASRGWHCWKGDVAAAFLQGRICEEELYCIPTPDLCKEMNIPPESITRLRKSCYGLVQAPYEWYETVKTHFHELGYRQCFSDPCCWVLKQEGEVRSIISGHVDDFVFIGNPQDEYWQRAKKSIQEAFRWGEFEEDKFTQCGVQISRQPDGGYTLNQERYMSHSLPVPLNSERRKQRKEPATEKEKSAMRGVLGAMSWHCSQVGFRYAAYVSLLLSQVPQATVETILETNTLLHKMKDASKEPMRIFPIPLNEIGMYAWSDASNQNRPSGHSTKGIFIGAAHRNLSKGTLEKISPMFWNSSKIDRVCRAPGASEAHAAMDAEDALWLIRYQWGEICGEVPEPRNPDRLAAKTPGTLITDSRSVYDKLQRPYISPTGQSKKIDIELVALKNCQNETNLEIRWVNSEAMLSNSLTKKNEDEQMNRFIACRQSWRIVEDAEMFSGKKLKKAGRDLLDLKDAGTKP